MVGAKIKIKSPFEKYAMCSRGTEGWRQWPEREGNDCLGSDSLVLLAATEFSFMKDRYTFQQAFGTNKAIHN
jgi:hypothetical protein